MGSLATSGPLSTGALLRRQFRLAHELLEAAIDQLPTETVHLRPHDLAGLAGASYARGVVCEDLSVNGVLAAGTSLALSAWIGRTGLSELPPLGRPADGCDWSRRVRLDLAAFRPYARAVYAATDAYLDSLADEALDLAWGERTFPVQRGGEVAVQGGRQFQTLEGGPQDRQVADDFHAQQARFGGVHPSNLLTAPISENHPQQERTLRHTQARRW